MQHTNEYERIKGIVELILEDYEQGKDIDGVRAFEQPDQDQVIDIVNKLMRVIFPGYYRDKVYKGYNAYFGLSTVIEDVMYNMNKQIGIVLRYDEKYANASDEEVERITQELVFRFFEQIPKIREYVDTDLDATFRGDPACFSKDEVVLSYPGLLATTIHRIAHELYVLGVPMIPRMMSEYAHSETGIDIHPGATIGKYLMIDHGTGVVVGSTTVIGDHVKLYQGVTLGALTTKDGRSLHMIKRHPTIEDYVTIYSGASLFGGETVIGEGAVIGSNVFITRSVPPHTQVSIRNQELRFKGGSKQNLPDMDLGCPAADFVLK